MIVNKKQYVTPMYRIVPMEYWEAVCDNFSNTGDIPDYDVIDVEW